MKKTILTILTFILTPILNICPIFMINIFFENQTGLGYLYHHMFLFLVWALNTVLLTYYYSKVIWEHYQLPYNKKRHALFHLGMFFACCIPYTESPGIWNDFHIWISLLCIAGYVYEWFSFVFHPLYTINLEFHKKLLGILFIFFVSTFPFIVYGSVISFGELLYSFLQPFYFYYWISSIESSKSEKCI